MVSIRANLLPLVARRYYGRNNSSASFNGGGDQPNLIIDTDAGYDDAVATIMALQAEKRGECKVAAITTVFGNVSCDQATTNIGALLNHLGRTDVPFFKGAEQPFVGEWLGCDWPGHGEDGFGNAALECPPNIQAGAPPAAAMLCHLVSERPGHYDILALGPLTNLAVAASLDPSFFSKVRSLTIMGGTRDGQGNAALGAEFNFHSDAEAAASVIDKAASCAPLLCTWELCCQHKMSWEFFDKLVSFNTPEAKLLKRVSAACQASERGMRTTGEGFAPCDSFAAAMLLRPQMIQQHQNLYAEVELHGKHSRGGIFYDWLGKGKKEHNVRLVNSLSQASYEEFLELTFSPHA